MLINRRKFVGIFCYYASTELGDLCAQGALEMQKKAIQRQERKAANSKEEIRTWMAQELEVLMATVEADYSLEKLMQDRASLVHQLEQLKKNNDPNEEELVTITEFIELRNAQIGDLQQKILESDQGKISEIIQVTFIGHIEITTRGIALINKIIPFFRN